MKVLSIMQPTQILAGVWQYQSSTHGTYGYMTPERCHVTPNTSIMIMYWCIDWRRGLPVTLLTMEGGILVFR